MPDIPPPDPGGFATAATGSGPLCRAGGQLLGAREVQQDEHGLIDGATLDPDGRHPVVIVADGMGGHAGGEMASRVAVRAFMDAYDLDGAPAGRLRAGLDAANRAIDAAVCENLSLDGMGTTLVAGAVTTDGLEWISVGDSPLYLYRGGRLKRLNEDHSMAPIIEALRESDPETARGMNPNKLRSALVGFAIAEAEALRAFYATLAVSAVLLLAVVLTAWHFAKRRRVQLEESEAARRATDERLAAAVVPAPFSCLLEGRDEDGRSVVVKVGAERRPFHHGPALDQRHLREREGAVTALTSGDEIRVGAAIRPTLSIDHVAR